MQGDCTPQKLADAVLTWFRNPDRCTELTHDFERMHLALHAGGGAATNAARAIAELVHDRRTPAQSR
jgi:lipid-A-disaccharide synthase